MVHWSDGGVVCEALSAKDLKQHGGDILIRDNSAGAVAENWFSVEQMWYDAICTIQQQQLIVRCVEWHSRGKCLNGLPVSTCCQAIFFIHNCSTVLVGCGLFRGQEIISVANWVTDGAVRLEHCRSATFLMSVQTASLTGVLSSDNCSGAAGTLVSQGPVTLRPSAKLIGFFRYASRFAGFESPGGCWRIRYSVSSRQHQGNAVFNKSSAPQVRLVRLFLEMAAMVVLWVRCNRILSYRLTAERHKLLMGCWAWLKCPGHHKQKRATGRSPEQKPGYPATWQLGASNWKKSAQQAGERG